MTSTVPDLRPRSTRHLLGAIAALSITGLLAFPQALPPTKSLASVIVGPGAATPSSIVVGRRVTVLFAFPVSVPAGARASVYLLRVDENGQPVDVVGRLRNNGQRGDVIANDQYFSLAVALKETRPGVARFRAAALTTPADRHSHRRSGSWNDDPDDDDELIREFRRDGQQGLRRRLFGFAFSEPLTVSVEPFRAEAPGPDGTMLPLEPGSAHGLVFGPTRFTPPKGRPAPVKLAFSTDQFTPPFVLYLRNGTAEGNRRTSAGQVVLDGVVLLDESDFATAPPGFVIPVNVGNRGELEVTLPRGRQAEVTLWLAANRALSIQPLAGSAVSETMSTEGGSITVLGPNGIRFALNIPPHAVLEPQEITVTVLSAIPNLPLSGGFRAGVHLEPSGLQLLRSATLEVTPPSQDLTGWAAFGYSGAGEQFHLSAFRRDADRVLIPVSHFSGVGLGVGTDEDVAQLIATSAPGTAEYFQNHIGAITRLVGGHEFSAAEQAVLRGAFTQWFAALVDPALTNALACGTADYCSEFPNAAYHALVMYEEWRTWLQWLGLDSTDAALNALDSSYQQRRDSGYQGVLRAADASCRKAVFCERSLWIEHFTSLAETLQRLYPADAAYVVIAEAICGGAQAQIIEDVAITPAALTVPLQSITSAALEFTNANADRVAAPPSVSVRWDTLDHTIAFAEASTGQPNAVEVLGSKVGDTTLVATVKQCETTPAERSFAPRAAVEVIANITAVEVAPSRLSLQHGDVATVDVILRDHTGREVFPTAAELLPRWTEAFATATNVATLTHELAVCAFQEADSTGQLQCRARMRTRIVAAHNGQLTFDVSVANGAVSTVFELSVGGVIVTAPFIHTYSGETTLLSVKAFDHFGEVFNKPNLTFTVPCCDFVAFDPVARAITTIRPGREDLVIGWGTLERPVLINVMTDGVSIGVSGDGIVTTRPEFTSACYEGATCELNGAPDEFMTFVAKPSPLANFAGWIVNDATPTNLGVGPRPPDWGSRDVCGSQADCVVQLEREKRLLALFTPDLRSWKRYGTLAFTDTTSFAFTPNVCEGGPSWRANMTLVMSNENLGWLEVEFSAGNFGNYVEQPGPMCTRFPQRDLDPAPREWRWGFALAIPVVFSDYNHRLEPRPVTLSGSTVTADGLTATVSGEFFRLVGVDALEGSLTVRLPDGGTLSGRVSMRQEP